jgi:hypothetical protein
MAPDPLRGGALAPVEGALISYLKQMDELLDENMPEVVAHEYTPFHDSSDLGPADWAMVGTCHSRVCFMIAMKVMSTHITVVIHSQ